MNPLIWIPIAVVVCAAMELWAALLHGRVWHHVLWKVHRSHHRRKRGRFEANDALSALHAPIAIALIIWACQQHGAPLGTAAFGVGVGMSAFGLLYFVVHDGLVHGRLPVTGLLRFAFFARVRDAHLEHHRRHGAPYGLFLGPLELARALRKERPRQPSAPAREAERTDVAEGIGVRLRMNAGGGAKK